MHINNDDKNVSKSLKANMPKNFIKEALEHLCDRQDHTCLNRTFMMRLVSLKHEQMHQGHFVTFTSEIPKAIGDVCDVTM
jgi:hypothetical protein